MTTTLVLRMPETRKQSLLATDTTNDFVLFVLLVSASFNDVGVPITRRGACSAGATDTQADSVQALTLHKRPALTHSALDGL